MAENIILSYEGAKGGRRTQNWKTSNADANAEIAPDLQTLRNRSRDLIRSNPHGARAASIVVNSAVGTGIIPQAASDNPKLNIRIDKLFADWAAVCDAENQLDFYGLQQLNTRAIFESGAALMRFRGRRPEDNLPVPLQLQTLECDYIDLSAYQNTSGGVTINGIEYDAIGRRKNYWIYDTHPGSAVPNLTTSWLSKAVPADQFVHAYRKDRPQQTHGVPWLAPVMMLMRDMDEYSDALLVGAKIAACLALFVSQPEGAGGITLGSNETEASTSNRIETFRPGMVMYGRAGEEAQPIVPPNHGGSVDYLKYLQRVLAIGMDLHYSQLSGDLSEVNWSSFRAGDRDFRSNIEAFRWLCVIPMMLQPIWDRVISAAYVAGKLPVDRCPVIWTPPPFVSVDPVKDAEADDKELSNGTLTWPDAILRKGGDPEKWLQRIIDSNKKIDDAKLVFGYDRRKVTANGIAQVDQLAVEKAKSDAAAKAAKIVADKPAPAPVPAAAPAPVATPVSKKS
jgi:lambda family phage portal protein